MAIGTVNKIRTKHFVEANAAICIIIDLLSEFSYSEEVDPDLPWAGVVFGMFISNVWYWCTDQVRILGQFRSNLTKNALHSLAHLLSQARALSYERNAAGKCLNLNS